MKHQFAAILMATLLITAVSCNNTVSMGNTTEQTQITIPSQTDTSITEDIQDITEQENTVISDNIPDSIYFEDVTATEPPEFDPSRDADGKFAIAIIPDTQFEVVDKDKLENRSFIQRCEWLAEMCDLFDIRLAVHTGDITLWGHRSDIQFPLTASGFQIVKNAGIMLSLCLGNHDTNATIDKTTENLRETETFNRFFGPDYYDEIHTYEDGKTDNAFQLFTACGTKFMIMNLEMHPRAAVLDWVENIVQEYCDTNILIATHSYLTYKGSILDTIEYGDTAPSLLYERIVSKYENIKMVFSGHTGTANRLIETHANGNKTASFLGGFHAEENLVQILEIDVESGSASINTYYPYENRLFGNYGYSVEDISFIKP